MSRGIIYPAYGYTPALALAIARIEGISRTRPIEAIDTEGEPSTAMAASTALADETPMPARLGAGEARATAGATVIDQTDTARFHRLAAVENPFESLLEARLHLGLATHAD
jgi:hypothetical protein